MRMIRRLFTFLFFFFALFSSAAFALDVSQSFGPESAEINKSVIFDASKLTHSLGKTNLSYEWLLGDGNREQGVEVVHSYSESGEYLLELTVRNAAGLQEQFQQSIFIYEKSFILVTNRSDQKERIAQFISAAREQGIYVDLLETFSSESEFLEEEELRQQLVENLSELEAAENILIYTVGSSGLTVLTQFKDTFQEKEIYFISDENFSSLSNIARGIYQSIQPSFLILTRFEALWVLLEVESVDEFTTLLAGRGVGFELVDDNLNLRPWNFLSVLVNTMIDKGVPSNMILLILMLPIIVTVVAFMKQVVGIDTLGVYTPSILTLSFIALNLWFGLLIFVALLLIGGVVRHFLHRYRLLYIPRMAIVLTFVSLTILLLLFLGAYFEIGNVAGIAIFPMLIMSTMVEKFVTIQSDRGFKGAVKVVLEVLSVSILCYFVADWGLLKTLVLGHPEIILFFLVFNFLLARWSGLRLTEYIRFRELIHHIEE